MESFTPLASTLGGVLIGLSATLVLFGLGRIAGISGIFGGVVASPKVGDVAWRVAFLLGLVAGGVAMYVAAPALFAVPLDRSLVVVVVAGLLVGLGARIGQGCTSGHGVCGVSWLSTRSIVATATFMATGALTVFVVRHALGGLS